MPNENTIKTIVDYASISREFGAFESATAWRAKITVDGHHDLTNEQVEELYRHFSLDIPAEGLRFPHNYIRRSGENSITVYVRDKFWDYDAHLVEMQKLLSLSDEEILKDD